MKKKLGATLIEIIIVATTLFLLLSLLKVGLTVVNHFNRQSDLMFLKNEAQVVLYEISRDIRNCNSFVTITQDRLVLNSYNTRGVYDSEAYKAKFGKELFDPSNLDRTTYEFVDNGLNSYLQKSIVSGGKTTSKRMLIGKISPPSFDLPISTSIPNTLSAADASSVEVLLRLRTKWSRESNQQPRIMEFKTQAMKRT